MFLNAYINPCIHAYDWYKHTMHRVPPVVTLVATAYNMARTMLPNYDYLSVANSEAH